MKIAFGVCSLGIGHAIRSLPIIRKFDNEGHEVILITYGRAYSLLKREFPHLKIYSLEDYPIKYAEKAHQLIPYIISNSHKIIKTLIDSHRKFLLIDSRENFDLIISDSRYDVFVRNKPSYLIIHQLRIMLNLAFLRGGTMFYNSYMSKYFRKIIVPDFRDNGLSGEMSHNVKFIDPKRIEYVGILTPFRKLNVPKDVDLLISISGPEPQRSIFERKIMNSLNAINGNIVVTLGRPEREEKKEGKIKIYSYLSLEKREELMNRAKLIISRSGYSTIMDLFAIGGRAFFVPTPGQPEQVYLARYLKSKNIAGYQDQENMNLHKMVEEAKKYRGFKGGYDVNRTLENIWRVIF